ncbi:MAG: methyltransferase domain-containing protein [Alphaproteobacteria bacterium]|nr:MAG: methyltransferase domain-containing protein [Alphaproteobacteria bacterium]
MSYTINDIFLKFKSCFHDNATQKAWYAVGAVLNKNLTELWLEKDIKLSQEQSDFCDKVINSLKYDVPLHRILHAKWFWKDKFIVSPYNFEPRPETETIIEISLNLKPKKILDIGTGTGCILLSLLREHNCYGFGLDCSFLSILSFIENAKNLGIRADCGVRHPNNYTFTNVVLNPTLSEIRKNKFSQVYDLNQKFDLIVSNPPYVHNNIKTDYATKFDPICAVFDENATKFAQNLPLSSDGVFLCEIPDYMVHKYVQLFQKNLIIHQTTHKKIFIFEYHNCD